MKIAPTDAIWLFYFTRRINPPPPTFHPYSSIGIASKKLSAVMALFKPGMHRPAAGACVVLWLFMAAVVGIISGRAISIHTCRGK